MGIYVRGKRLYFRFKGPKGKWKVRRSEYLVGQEELARKALRELADRISAGAAIVGQRNKAVTLQEFANLTWFETRRGMVSGADRDEGRLELHVFPRHSDPKLGSIHLGAMPLEDVRARHLKQLFAIIRREETLAPKSIHNVYGVLQALFRDAEIEGLIDRSPCILNHHQLGKNVDKDSEWRKSAVYTRVELEQLVSDVRIPLERRVMYGLEGIGGLRHGEAAGLRWRHIDTTTKPLGQLQIATSYDQGHTKTWVTRYQPIHPVLASLLAEWKLSGWSAMLGKQPGPDDLVVPTPKPTNKGPRVPAGSMRSSGWSWKRFAQDLELLGYRHRRGHDLRRTCISLARSDGAIMDILRRGTHRPPKEVIEGYTTFEWDVQCRELLKLQLNPGPMGEVIAMPMAVGAAPPEGSIQARSKDGEVSEDQEESMWRRWESNRRPKVSDIAEQPAENAESPSETEGSEDAGDPPIGRRPAKSEPGWIVGSRRSWRPPAIRTHRGRELLALIGGAA